MTLLLAFLLGFDPAGKSEATPAARGRLVGIVWLDLNDNGLQELGEGPAPRVTLTLLPVGNEVNAAGGRVVQADLQGIFEFGDLPVGQYQVFATDGQSKVVTLSEVNATVSVILAVRPARIYLPMAGL